MLEVMLVLMVLVMTVSCLHGHAYRCIVRKLCTRPTTRSDRNRPFRCLVKLICPDDNSAPQVFEVKIIGLSLPAPHIRDLLLQILIADVTDGPKYPQPVLSTYEPWQMEDSPAFCLRSHLHEHLPRQAVSTTHSAVANIRVDSLKFPRRGIRKLRFITSVISPGKGKELAVAAADIDYENGQCGYIDTKENHQRAESLSVQLAVAVCGSTGRLNEAGIRVIRQWIAAKAAALAQSQTASKTRQRLERSLKEAVKTLPSSTQGNIESLCKNISETATIVQRYAVTELCLQVVRAAGSISQKHTDVLSRLTKSLQVDADKFRAMTQKILPVGMYETRDAEFILGITEDMSAADIRKHLNSEYRKWNARVTHPDPDTRHQASRMLSLIADAHSKYTEQMGVLHPAAS